MRNIIVYQEKTMTIVRLKSGVTHRPESNIFRMSRKWIRTEYQNMSIIISGDEAFGTRPSRQDLDIHRSSAGQIHLLECCGECAHAALCRFPPRNMKTHARQPWHASSHVLAAENTTDLHLPFRLGIVQPQEVWDSLNNFSYNWQIPVKFKLYS